MPKTIKAVYEEGVFKPINKPDIAEHQQVSLVIVPGEELVTTPSSILKVIDHLKEGLFPERSSEEMAKDLEIDIG
ncbi:MAG: antitoxin family protein [Candidatus Scalindua sp.]